MELNKIIAIWQLYTLVKCTYPLFIHGKFWRQCAAIKQLEENMGSALLKCR